MNNKQKQKKEYETKGWINEVKTKLNVVNPNFFKITVDGKDIGIVRVETIKGMISGEKHGCPINTVKE